MIGFELSDNQRVTLEHEEERLIGDTRAGITLLLTRQDVLAGLVATLEETAEAVADLCNPDVEEVKGRERADVV